MSDTGPKPELDKPAAAPAETNPAAASGSVEPPLINISKGMFFLISIKLFFLLYLHSNLGLH